MKNDLLTDFTLTWAGECSAWECDELGHMNMRHYVHKTDEARRSLIIKLGLPRAFHPGVASTVRCRDFHIKYQGEARPGNPLRIDSAILELGESTAQRGGRPKRFFTVTGQGQEALKRARSAMDKLWEQVSLFVPQSV